MIIERLGTQTGDWEVEWLDEVQGLLERDAGWGWKGFWECVRRNLNVCFSLIVPSFLTLPLSLFSFGKCGTGVKWKGTDGKHRSHLCPSRKRELNSTFWKWYGCTGNVGSGICFMRYGRSCSRSSRYYQSAMKPDDLVWSGTARCEY